MVAIIVTGKEIVAPGASLQNGQVYDANSFTITAVLQQLNINAVYTVYTNDDLPEVVSALQAALQRADLLLLSGGISAGNYDFVREAALQCGISEVFYKVNQKPGKPLFFGPKITGSSLACPAIRVLPLPVCTNMC